MNNSALQNTYKHASHDRPHSIDTINQFLKMVFEIFTQCVDLNQYILVYCVRKKANSLKFDVNISFLAHNLAGLNE